MTGSIAGVIGLDVLSLTGNEASTWDASEQDRIAHVADLTRKAAAEGALITLSAHMPNFEVIDQRVKAFDAAGGAVDVTDSEKVGYWTTQAVRSSTISPATHRVQRLEILYSALCPVRT